jgi:pyrroloquinoline quinone (PQQ) biosynthesis protein C
MDAMTQLSPHPKWVLDMEAFVSPYRNALIKSDWTTGIMNSTLTVEEMRGWILQIYPFIHTFPKFLAEALTKVDDDDSRSFLIDNIRVEKAHAEHWVWMGMGFGLKKEEMLGLASGIKPILQDVQSLSDWLWYVNSKGSLAEAVAATSFAIEGITGELARLIVDGFEAYRGRDGVDMGPKTYKWMREHAKYDDEHPHIALEIVKRYVHSSKSKILVMNAVKRSLQLLYSALDVSYRAYTPARNNGHYAVSDDKRTADRRNDDPALIEFPERRFRERRGLSESARSIVK